MGQTFLPIYEVLHLSGITPQALLDLLSRGLIGFKSGSGGELLLDLDTITPELIARHGLSDPADTAGDARDALIEELVGAAVLKAMGSIVEESFLLARQWLPSEAETPHPEERASDRSEVE